MKLPSFLEPLFRFNYRQFLSWRYLRSRLVNLISVAGVMAGVAVLIIVVAIMDGFQERVRRTTRGALSDLTMTPFEPPLLVKKAPEADPLEMLEGFDDREPPVAPDPVKPTPVRRQGNRVQAPRFAELEEQLKRIDPRIKAAAPQMMVPVGYFYKSRRRSSMRLGDQELFLMEAIGIDWDKERKVSDLEKNLLHAIDPANPFFEQHAKDHKKLTVMVSKRFGKRYLLRTRNDADLPQLLGREFNVSVLLPDSEGGYSQRSYTAVISAIYEGQDVTESENRLYVDLDWAREISGLDIGYQEVRVKLTDYDEAHSVREMIKARLDGFAIDTWEEIRRDFLQAVDSEKVLLVIVLSFIIMLGGFIILATLTLTVVEKTRDIGILAALGATRGGILSVFVWTGLWIGILGATLGVLAGAWFVDNVEEVRKGIKAVTDVDVFPPHIYRFRTIPAIWDWPSAIKIASGAIIMSFIAGLVPALRAARMDPVKALRHD